MAGELVARRYAQALLDIGVERDNCETIREQLNQLAQLLEEVPAFSSVLLNPSLRLSERRDVIRAIADKYKWDPVVRNFSLILLDNHRVDVAGAIARQFGEMVDKRLGNIRAHVTSAVELDATQRAEIKAALVKLTGKNVLLETDTDAEILGGAITRIGSVVYDGSTRSHIERLRQSILAEV
ncbi:ATP synthase F1 subunit delta [Bradymonas sediminis]|uniref:ATP synthase subunit delta n=1 Tax=Bradymonas sediminis TaxID=1548548 RepID=A0A2Z4FM27_9DELT|nr:ATP synthase F1 subunit delta [Bradymonas sediminis]AWV89865.1 ATP synthase F1 subunit delta [Bradymonas sediminis]TDP76383.1 ATP synthase F1 subcomplex delta subunit [Bradymonas sediminis]